MIRKDPLITGEYYHIFNKAIGEIRIFHYKYEFDRMLYLMQYYQLHGSLARFSDFIRSEKVTLEGIQPVIDAIHCEYQKRVEIIAYCLMPTHFHFVLKQNQDHGIKEYMRFLLNGYSSYFNKKYKRKGPLWVGRFKSILVNHDNQMFHLIRYIHLNPPSADLVDKPQDWSYSSYREYLGQKKGRGVVTEMLLYESNTEDYREAVECHMPYQKELQMIKNLIIE